jgi:hypothetical protein
LSSQRGDQSGQQGERVPHISPSLRWGAS